MRILHRPAQGDTTLVDTTSIHCPALFCKDKYSIQGDSTHIKCSMRFCLSKYCFLKYS